MLLGMLFLAFIVWAIYSAIRSLQKMAKGR
jgi:hypothetical protein